MKLFSVGDKVDWTDPSPAPHMTVETSKMHPAPLEIVSVEDVPGCYGCLGEEDDSLCGECISPIQSAGHPQWVTVRDANGVLLRHTFSGLWFQGVA